MSWPMIKVPGPKESGKWTAGRINIICFSFSDTYPRKLNNFLWQVRGWPLINWLSILWARGGFDRCAYCKKSIGPSVSCVDAGNMLPKAERFYHSRCYDSQFCRASVREVVE